MQPELSNEHNSKIIWQAVWLLAETRDEPVTAILISYSLGTSRPFKLKFGDEDLGGCTTFKFVIFIFIRPEWSACRPHVTGAVSFRTPLPTYTSLRRARTLRANPLLDGQP